MIILGGLVATRIGLLGVKVVYFGGLRSLVVIVEEGCGELVRLRGLEVGGPCGFGSRFKRVGYRVSHAGEKRTVTIGMRCFGRESVWEGG